MISIIHVALLACLTSNSYVVHHFKSNNREILLALEPDDNNLITTSHSCIVSRTAFVAAMLCLPTLAVASPPVPLSSAKESSMRDDKPGAVIKSTTARDESISGFLAGGALTVTKTVVKYPLDTATVRLQMPNSTYSIFNAVELFDGSYDGILPPLVANVPGGAVFFAVKDACKATLKDTFPNLPRFASTMASVAIAQIPYWLVRNPSEVVKTRQQARLNGYYGDDVTIFGAYKKVIDDATPEHEETNRINQLRGGIRAFYTGYSENILYAYPADVVKFIAYEQITQGRKDLSGAEASIAGAISTAAAQMITTPLDVVRNRLMTDIQRSKNDSQTSYIDTLVNIGKEEGLSGLFAGVLPRIGKALVSGAIQFATYEETKKDLLKILGNK